MGLLQDFLQNKNKEQVEERSKAEKLIDYLNENPEIKYRNEFLRLLNSIIEGDYLYTNIKEDDLCRIIFEICKNNESAKYIEHAEKLYNIIVFNNENKEQVELFHNFFKIFLKIDKFFINDFGIIYNLFNNKNLVLAIYSYIANNSFPSTYFVGDIQYYIKEARQYYVDEEAFYASIMKVMEAYKNKADFGYKIVEKAILENKKAIGIYDIDEVKIDNLAHTVDDLKDDISELEKLEKNLKEKLDNIDTYVDDSTKQVINSGTHDFKVLYKNALEDIKSSVLKTQNVEEDATNKIKRLGEKYVQTINYLLDINPDLPQKIKDDLANNSTYSEILSSNGSLKEKREMVWKKMNKSSEIYHETFDRIMKYVLMGKPVMLVGPSGSGKTYTVEQIARLLDLPLYNFGFIADEFASIKGYNDFQGNFVKTPFYDCLKYGGICFYDEADNSEARAFMEINKVVGAKGYSPYTFPNGEVVQPHPNFRIIATANTWGDGADTIHSARERLDGATLNRFERIYYDYDKELEKSIMKKYEDMYNFAIAYRQSVNVRKIDKIVSTRDLNDICQYLDSGEFTYDEIIESKFINGMRQDSLSGILSDLAEILNEDNQSFSEFKRIINGGKVKVK